MALNLPKFEREVAACVEAGHYLDLEYVLLKVAMEVQDKANMLSMLQQQTYRVKSVQEIEHAAKMQKLRFKRFANVFKICHEHSY